MSKVYGIYGYEITKEINGPGFKIEPISESVQTSHISAADEESYHLTALVHGDLANARLIFQLQAILTFIEQREVLISGPHLCAKDEKHKNIANKISIPRTGTPGKFTVLQDYYSNDGRSELIIKCLSLLNDEKHCNNTRYDTLLFRNVETLRLRTIMVELFYFLHFSALESHARAVLKDTRRSAANVIARQLSAYRLNVEELNLMDDQSSISTYSHIRNSIFHNGEFNPTVNYNSSYKTFKATEFLSALVQLSNLTVLKATGFDDGHINWNGWKDRQTFI